jgi:hypothetical protein
MPQQPAAGGAPTGRKRQPQVLAAPRHRPNAGAFQPCGIDAQRPAQRLAQPQSVHHGAFERRRQGGSGDFDLGQFRHVKAIIRPRPRMSLAFLEC